ncbi:Calcium-dependent protein kinase, variant 2 [Trifolium repens]|nr:Calcium-dependent protein kinase [Trifolium repens]WJX96192.1 Calcium-dependent protein kinase, variant 2 [Trifolium repens]WJX96195.1 Calcium-dependent protein kinase, variant 2 [Trifolium repens]
MASSSRNEAVDLSKIQPWLPTKIYPDKDEIYVCTKWLKKYEDKIDFHSPAWISNLSKGATMVKWQWDHGRWFLKSGITVANDNLFRKPANVILFYKEDNKFKIWMDKKYDTKKEPVEKPNQEPVMAHFKTTIFPDKESIKVCGRWLRQWEPKLQIGQCGSIYYGGCQKECGIKFNKINGDLYMRSGVNVAKKFGFKEPFEVVLCFEGDVNKFSMWPATGGNIPSHDQPSSFIKEEEDLSADDGDQLAFQVDDNDDDEDDDDDDDDEDDDVDPTPFFKFNVTITQAMDTSMQVFHFPNKTSRHVLLDNQDQIYIRDVETGIIIKCSIGTSSRKQYEKHIGQGWNDYKLQKKLNAGDVLHCTIEDPPTHINIKVDRCGSSG